ncbi:MAG: molecular chaperone DnaJ [Planctomycetota bacterium]|jgi:molecular chaperone DnaJ
MSDKRDFYEVLGVARDASQADIKRSYRKLAMQHHPDRNPDDDTAESKFKEAAEAYDVLGNEEKRAQYNQFGHQAFAQGGGYQGQRFSTMEDVFSAFGDMFSGGGGGGGGRRSQSRRGPAPGRDLRIVLDLTLEEISTGVTRTVALKRFEYCKPCKGSGGEDGSEKVTCNTCAGRGQVQRNQGFFTMAATCPTCRGAGQKIDKPCNSCHGAGKSQEKNEVEIRIPVGLEEGVQLRITGEGDVGEKNAPRGDLYCVIREKQHKIFQRSGPDLMTEVPCSFTTLALGEKVEIPTLDGRVEMTIPAGTQTGKVLRLRGQGLPNMDAPGTGDLLVRVFIEVPTKINDRQKELLREFGEIEEEQSGNVSFFEKIANYFS